MNTQHDPLPCPIAANELGTQHLQAVDILYFTQPDGQTASTSELWLHGQWIEAAGLKPGDKVAINALDNIIIIQKVAI